jgi:hypothetical protein
LTLEGVDEEFEMDPFANSADESHAFGVVMPQDKTGIEEAESFESFSFQDGVMWSISRGTAPSVDDLEFELAEVKQLFDTTFEESKTRGVWSVTCGEAPTLECLEGMLAEVKGLVPAGAPTLEDLEEGLETVKNLFAEKYGDSVDGWSVVRGAAPCMADLEQQLADVKHLHGVNCLQAAPSVDDLELELTEVKQLFNAQFEESEVQGVWFVARGETPTTDILEAMLAEVKGLVPQAAPTVEDLEEELEAVKEFFATKCGDSVDGWSVRRGEAPTLDSLEAMLAGVKLLVSQGSPTMADLEEELGAVRELFATAFGDVVNAWSVRRGEAPTLDRLEAMLAGVKVLVPQGFPTMEDLEQGLGAVKELFATKCGDFVDSWSVARGEAPTLDNLETMLAGVKVLVPEVSPTMEDLEEELGTVKELFATKCGEFVEGWFIARGEAPTLDSLEAMLTEVKVLVPQGSPSMEDLEEELGAVKELFATKCEDFVDGWFAARGEAPTLDSLEAMLTEVKVLVPQGSPSMEYLEEELGAVKELFATKCGDFVDGWSVARGEVPTLASLQAMLTEVKVLVPQGSPTMEDLEEELAGVQELLATKCGDSMDSWSITRGEAPTLDSLEAMLTEVKVLVPRGFPTMEDLEEELGAVKELFVTKCGDVVDRWSIARGEAPTLDNLEAMFAAVKLLVPQGSPTMEDLEDELGSVKELFAMKCVDCMDSWSVCRGEAPTLDSLEAMLIEAKVLLPQGPPTVEDLEEELGAVKELLTKKHEDFVGGWSVARGEAPTLDSLEATLAEVKVLAPQGSPSMDDLEEDLEALKELFATKCGDFVDGWSVVRGVAPSMAELESYLCDVKMLMPEFHCPEPDDLQEDLAFVKLLFSSKFGDYVDDWTVTRGVAPTLESLEQDLLDVKLLHESKLGAADIERASGITWAVSRGGICDIPTIDSLEMDLQAVKSSFDAKFGVIAESED